MRVVRQDKAPSDEAVRLQHLIAPWTVGSESIWLGIATLKSGASTTPKAFSDLEGVHFTLAGHGKEIVDGEEVNTEPGTCVMIPRGARHQVINVGSDPLVLISITSPPLSPPS